MEWIIVKTLLSLAAIVGLMVGLVFLAKKYLNVGRGDLSKPIDIQVVGYRALQPKRAVYVLKVLNKVMIVGMTENCMQTLGEIEDQASLEAIEKSLVEGASGQSWFKPKSSEDSTVSQSFATVFNANFARFIGKTGRAV